MQVGRVEPELAKANCVVVYALKAFYRKTREPSRTMGRPRGRETSQPILTLMRGSGPFVSRKKNLCGSTVARIHTEHYARPSTARALCPILFASSDYAGGRPRFAGNCFLRAYTRSPPFKAIRIVTLCDDDRTFREEFL